MSNPKHAGKTNARTGVSPTRMPGDMWTDRNRHAPEASFADCAGCAATIDTVIDAGALFMVGRTSDGGAICITIKLGERNWRTYVSKQDELDAVLAQAFTNFRDG